MVERIDALARRRTEGSQGSSSSVTSWCVPLRLLVYVVKLRYRLKVLILNFSALRNAVRRGSDFTALGKERQ